MLASCELERARRAARDVTPSLVVSLGGGVRTSQLPSRSHYLLFSNCESNRHIGRFLRDAKLFCWKEICAFLHVYANGQCLCSPTSVWCKQ